MPSSSPKAAHYRTALGAALVRGAWVDTTPGATPSGSPLSWSELIRKWGKHTGGNTTLIHYLREISLLYLSRTSTSQPSSSYINVTHDQVKSLPNSPSPAGTAATSTATTTPTPGTRPDSGSFVHIPHPHLHKSRKSLESSAPPAAAVSDRRAAYLSISDLDAEPGTRAWGPLDGPEAEEAREGIAAIEALVASGKLKPAEQETAKFLLAYHHHAIGEHEKVLEIYKTVDWSKPTSGAVEGDAAVLDRIRLSLELTGAPDAVHAYTASVDLLPSLTSVPFGASPFLPSPSGKVHPRTSFDNLRELARVLSTALVRAAYLSARTPDTKRTLNILRMYQAITAEWPATFRPAERTGMFLLLLRALVSAQPSGLVSASEAKEAFRFGQQWLGQTTTFPRAGNVNRPVVQFVELVVAFHPLFPDLARDIISVLWWSTNVTFQSHSALRHLARLLSSVGESKDARRTFELYVELVLKSRQTSQPDVSLQLKRRPTDDMAAGPAEIRAQAREAQQAQNEEDEQNASAIEDGGELVQTMSKEQKERKEQTAESEVDQDPEFVDALVTGARMLLRDFDEPDEAWRYASLAGDVAKGKGDLLVAKAEECKGVVRSAMASRGFDPAARPIVQAQAIDHLRAAAALDPHSASAQYHLAFAEAEARALEPATEAVRASLELDSRNVQAWHLLALLLTAANDWTGAARACDAGIGVWEQNDEDDATGTTSSSPDATQPPPTPASGIPVESKDFAVVPPTPELPSFTEKSTPLPPKPHPLLGANDQLHPLPSRKARVDRAQRLADIIRLRSTRAVITEKLQGPEAAMLAQQELFAFFSSRCVSAQGGLAGMAKSPSIRSRMSFKTPASLIATPSVRSRGDLGGSYVSITDAADEQEVVTDEKVDSTINSATTARPRVVSTDLAPPIVMTAASSPGSSSPGSGSVTNTDVEDDFGRRNRTRSATNLSAVAAAQGRDRLGKSDRLKPKHLNPSAARAGSLPGSSSDLTMYRSHTASTSTSALSLAPTVVGSLYRAFGRSTTTQSPPSPPPEGPLARPRAEARTLSDLWLSSAATFRRWRKPEQALVAIEEAEQLDPDNPAVWCQLGMYHVSQGAPELAAPAFTKALLLSEDYPAAIVGLGRVYLDRATQTTTTTTTQANHNPMGTPDPSSLSAPVAQLVIDPAGSKSKSTTPTASPIPASAGTGTTQPPANPSAGLELASALLTQLTTANGWDIGEAWFRLGQICEKQGKQSKAVECYQYALDLEGSRPCRPWRECVDRWL